MFDDYTVNHIRWKEEYSLNNAHIDEEHKTLFSIARKAEETEKLHSKEEKNDFLKNILRELYLYTRDHFQSEEAYMKEKGFPDLEQHKQIHQTLLDQLNFIIVNLNVLDSSMAQSKLYYFVNKIFVEHIKKYDSQVAKFVQQ